MGIFIQTAEMGTNPTGGADRFGWVSGSFKALAASASVQVFFDLGPAWRNIKSLAFVAVPQGPSSGLSGVQSYNTDQSTPPTPSELSFGLGPGSPSPVAISSGVANHQTLNPPMARYFGVSVTNADAVSAQGADAFLRLSATFEV